MVWYFSRYLVKQFSKISLLILSFGQLNLILQLKDVKKNEDDVLAKDTSPLLLKPPHVYGITLQIENKYCSIPEVLLTTEYYV